MVFVVILISNRSSIEQNKEAITKYKRNTAEILSKLPTILQDTVYLQIAPVIQGDYDLKIFRQEHCIEKQDEVIFLENSTNF